MANFFKVSTKKSANVQSNQTLTVNIERLDLNGSGVTYVNNKPVFINRALPNENVDIRIIEKKNKYSIATLLTINKVSRNRVPIKCQHFKLCGGCDLQHIDYQQQLQFKKNKIIELFSRSGITESMITALPWQAPIMSSPWNYRRKARIGVQFDKNSQATIGFRQKATNQLVAIKSCPVLVEPADKIFPLLKSLINQLSVKKSIGHIEIIISDSSTESSKKTTLIIRQLRAINAHDLSLWQKYAEQNKWSIHFQENEGLECKEKIAINSDDILSFYLVNNIKIDFYHTDFIQVNQKVNVAMVEQALSWLMPKAEDNILDLFCGLGNFSLPLAQQANSVVGVEGVQSMVDKARANAELNNLNNCSFFQADLNSEWLSHEESNKWVQRKFTKVLLDPARAGAENAIAQVIKLNIPTILYVSCEPTTLARDSQILLLQGYKIEKIGLIDMFSQTKHVETMVLFHKSIHQ